jgi:HPt (histidine-containing phosphotransfer) domain-containing protein
VDWDVVKQLELLQQQGNPDFAREMQTLFLAETPALLTKIQESVATRDAENLRRAAHTLKGSSNSVGAKRLGGLSFELEKIGKSGDTTGADIYLAELDPEFDRLRAAFKSSQHEKIG